MYMIVLGELADNVFLQNVSAGVVASFLTLFVLWVFRTGAIPWFEQRVYKDAHYEGLWEGFITYPESNDTEVLSLKLTRSAHRVGGWLKDSEGDEYELSGEFRNGIMTLTYSARDKRAIDRGCFTFLLSTNGRELKGYVAFYHTPYTVVHATCFNAHRVDKHVLGRGPTDAIPNCRGVESGITDGQGATLTQHHS